MPKFAYRATFTREDGSQGVENGDVTAPAANHAASKVTDDLLKNGSSPKEVTTWRRPNS